MNAAAVNRATLTAEVASPRAPDEPIPSITATSSVRRIIRSPRFLVSKKSGGSRCACATRSSRSRSANRSLASDVRHSAKYIATAATATTASHQPASRQNPARWAAASTWSVMRLKRTTVTSSHPETASVARPPSTRRRRSPLVYGQNRRIIVSASVMIFPISASPRGMTPR
jgi:hypothetical protein